MLVTLQCLVRQTYTNERDWLRQEHFQYMESVQILSLDTTVTYEGAASLLTKALTSHIYWGCNTSTICINVLTVILQQDSEKIVNKQEILSTQRGTVRAPPLLDQASDIAWQHNMIRIVWWYCMICIAWWHCMIRIAWWYCMIMHGDIANFSSLASFRVFDGDYMVLHEAGHHWWAWLSLINIPSHNLYTRNTAFSYSMLSFHGTCPTYSALRMPIFVYEYCH